MRWLLNSIAIHLTNFPISRNSNMRHSAKSKPTNYIINLGYVLLSPVLSIFKQSPKLKQLKVLLQYCPTSLNSGSVFLSQQWAFSLLCFHLQIRNFVRHQSFFMYSSRRGKFPEKCFSMTANNSGVIELCSCEFFRG